MSKVTKKQLQRDIYNLATELTNLKIELSEKNVIDINSKPQLKQLDQSVFDHPYVDDRFKYVALNADSQAVFFESKPVISKCLNVWVVHTGSVMPMLKGYDTTDWQNSLIERDIAKELAEVDLSSELTGSELCRAMLERGDNYIMCVVGTIREVVIIDTFQDGYFYSKGVRYLNPKPINNQGEPLTAAEAGF